MSESAVVTFLFTDLVGSTEMLDRLGDDVAEQVRRTHFRLLRDAVTGAGGEEVKNLGDGLMVAFTSVLAAVRCATAMQQAVPEHRLAVPDRRTMNRSNSRVHWQRAPLFRCVCVALRWQANLGLSRRARVGYGAGP